MGTVHDFSALHVADKYDALHGIYLRHVLPRLVRRLSRIVTVSESTRQDVLRFTGVEPALWHLPQRGCTRCRFHARR